MSTKVTQQVMDFVKSIAKNDGGRNEKYIDHKKGYMELCNLLSGNMLTLTEDDKDYLMGLKLEYENRYFPDFNGQGADTTSSEETVKTDETNIPEVTEEQKDKAAPEEEEKGVDNKTVEEEPKTDKAPEVKTPQKTKKSKKKKRINPFDKRPRFIPKTQNEPSIQQKTVINKHIDNSHNNNYNYGNGNINIGGNMIISE